HGDPRGVFHDLDEDVAPLLHALRLLVVAGEGIGVRGARLEVLVAVARPVPAAGDVRRAGQDGPVEVVRIRVVGDPGHTARPQQWGLAGAAGFDHGALRLGAQLGVHADRRQVGLDGLSDAVVGSHVVGVELGVEAVRIAGLGQQRLGAFGVVWVARVVFGVALEQRRQDLAGGYG